MAWYVLKMRTAANAVHFRELLTEAGIFFFLPTIKQVVRRGAKDVVVEKPLLFSYIFVQTDAPIITAFVEKNEGVIALRERHSKQPVAPLLTIPDVQMKGFMTAVEMYGENLPVVSPTAEMVAKGDKVRIISGRLEGVEGILEAKQGKEGGRVFIRLDNLVAVPTVEIEAKYIEVLEFAKQGKHLYKKLDSFEPRLRKALDYYIWNKPLTPELHDYLSAFARRFGSLNVPALNARARFLSLLLMTYVILGQAEQASTTYHLLYDLKPSLKSMKYIGIANDALSIYKQYLQKK